MSGSSLRTGRWPVAVVLMAAVSLLLGMMLPVVAAPDAGAAQPAAGDSRVAGSSLTASQAAPMLMVSSSGDRMSSSVPAEAVAKCKAEKKATKKKVKKQQKKKIYKKSLKKAKKKAKKQGKKVTKKQKKKLKKKANKKANKKAKKAAKKAYDECLAKNTVTKVENVDFALRSAAGSTSADKVALDAAALEGLGDAPIGRFAGLTAAGEAFDVPVRYSDVSVADGVLSLTWVTATGGPGRRIQDMTVLRGLDRSATGGLGTSKNFAQASFVMQPKDAQTWRWSGAGSQLTTVQRSGSTVTAWLKGPESAGGLQPNGEVSALMWSDIQARLGRLTDGKVPTRLVLWASNSAGKTSGAVLKADSVVAQSDGSVKVSGTLAAGAGDAASVVPDGGQRVVSALLETPNNSYNNPGAKEYVVITGDSIASGEGARYTGTYVNPQLATLDVQGQENLVVTRSDSLKGAYENFCKWIDLSCRGVSVLKVEDQTPPSQVGIQDATVRFDSDPGRVYEDGSWEKAGQNEACHRSKTAPGTWLARYLQVVKGENVESINLACSGATTQDVLRTSFKGQPPQIEELDDLGNYLPIRYVVNTIGANDTGILDEAPACLLAPVAALGAIGGGGLDLTALLGNIPALIDDTHRVNGKTVSANPFFKVDSLCSEKLRGPIGQKVADTRAKVAEVIKALHGAAPDAKVVQTNYPSLIPASTKTYAPRQELWPLAAGYQIQGGFNGNSIGQPEAVGAKSWQDWMRGDADRWWGGKVLTGDATVPFADGLTALHPGAGNPVNDEMAYFAYLANNGSTPVKRPDGTELAQPQALTVWNQVLQAWTFGLRQMAELLNYGALMFGFDQDWVSKEVLGELNKVVLGAVSDADPNGEYTVAVDMTQVLNGRELGTKFNNSGTGTDPGANKSPGDAILDVPCATVGNTTTCLPNTGPGTAPGPESQRAQFVVSFIAGLNAEDGTAYPVLCPFRPDGEPDCLGDRQEALHPNWRGQAAQGQCIVAVVTGDFGSGGNACVRSVGDDNAAAQAAEVKYKGDDYGADLAGVELWSPVTGDDTLCLKDPAAVQADSAKGAYTDCAGGADPDPTWDTKRWDAGKVDYQGKQVPWQ